jgi:hypothetical protein
MQVSCCNHKKNFLKRNQLGKRTEIKRYKFRNTIWNQKICWNVNWNRKISCESNLKSKDTSSGSNLEPKDLLWKQARIKRLAVKAIWNQKIQVQEAIWNQRFAVGTNGRP